MALNLEDLSQLSRLFDEGMALSPGEREAWIDALPPTQRHLAPRLQRMLAAHERLTDALGDLPALHDGAVAEAGERVGPWRLVRELGRGGMGSVWLAERADGSYERQVALKLPRIAWAENLAARMARERRIGALLEHPAIARLYDAGLDDRGRPYIAMEYVEGVPIDRYCDTVGLAPRERVVLVLQVVQALAYAHGRLVVHRDIKPGNVMVSADGRAHLLDFGIAKLLDDGRSDERLTQEQGRVATPLYAAPEQLRGEAATVQADIWGLGLLLHELLTGALPREGRPWPSALGGDLAAVVSKALREDASARYHSADALAADLKHWLDGEPVSARPDPLLFRAARWFRRHRLATSSAALVLLSIAAGGSVAVVQSLRARQAAEREHAVRLFVAEVLRAPLRHAIGGESAHAPTELFLEHSARLARERLRDQPALQAELFAMVGEAFQDMGAYKLAADHARMSVEALKAAGLSGPALTEAHLRWGQALLGQRALAGAHEQTNLALGMAADAQRARVRVLAGRIAFARNDLKAGRARLDELQAELGRRNEAAPIEAAWALGLQAQWLAATNRLDEALPLLDQSIAEARRVDGELSLAAVEMNLLASGLLTTTLHAERARQYHRAAISVLDRLGANHAARSAIESAEFAAGQLIGGRQIGFSQASAEIGRARLRLEQAGIVLPEESRARLDQAEGRVLLFGGRPVKALPLLERAQAVLVPLAPDAWARRRASLGYAYVLRDLGQHERADAMLRQVVTWRAEAGRGAHPYAALDHAAVALNLVMGGNAREALAYLDALPKFDRVAAEGITVADRYNDRVRMERARAYLHMGDAARALAEFPVALLAEPADRMDALEVHGELLCAAGHSREGAQLLSRALSLREPGAMDTAAPELARVRSLLGACALRTGNKAVAREEALQARAAVDAQPGISPYYTAPLLKLEAALTVRH